MNQQRLDYPSPFDQKVERYEVKPNSRPEPVINFSSNASLRIRVEELEETVKFLTETIVTHLLKGKLDPNEIIAWRQKNK